MERRHRVVFDWRGDDIGRTCSVRAVGTAGVKWALIVVGAGAIGYFVYRQYMAAKKKQAVGSAMDDFMGVGP
jgi:hypothetical protein